MIFVKEYPYEGAEGGHPHGPITEVLSLARNISNLVDLLLLLIQLSILQTVQKM